VNTQVHTHGQLACICHCADPQTYTHHASHSEHGQISTPLDPPPPLQAVDKHTLSGTRLVEFCPKYGQRARCGSCLRLTNNQSVTHTTNMVTQWPLVEPPSVPRNVRAPMATTSQQCAPHREGKVPMASILHQCLKWPLHCRAAWQVSDQQYVLLAIQALSTADSPRYILTSAQTLTQVLCTAGLLAKPATCTIRQKQSHLRDNSAPWCINPHACAHLCSILTTPTCAHSIAQSSPLPTPYNASSSPVKKHMHAYTFAQSSQLPTTHSASLWRFQPQACTHHCSILTTPTCAHTIAQSGCEAHKTAARTHHCSFLKLQKPLSHTTAILLNPHNSAARTRHCSILTQFPPHTIPTSHKRHLTQGASNRNCAFTLARSSKSHPTKQHCSILTTPDLTQTPPHTVRCQPQACIHPCSFLTIPPHKRQCSTPYKTPPHTRCVKPHPCSTLQSHQV
jgi:hypothetical protein